MKITVFIKTSKQGSRVADTVEIPDELITGPDGQVDPDKLEAEARDVAFNHQEWGYFEGEDRPDGELERGNVVPLRRKCRA